MPELARVFIDKQEAVTRTGLTFRTLQRRLDAGEIPLYTNPKDRRRRLIALADIDYLVTPTPFERRQSIETST